jgi:GNAT superfamily N-acetyltransferase
MEEKIVHRVGGNLQRKVVFAQETDIPIILHFIRELALYERLADKVVATESNLRETLFGAHRYAEVLLATEDNKAVGFALFFHNYSTFLAQPGIYLEDLFVLPTHRGQGHGKALLTELAKLALDRGCGRLEWSVLNWNESALVFYRSLGAEALSEWTQQRVEGESLVRLGALAV